MVENCWGRGLLPSSLDRDSELPRISNQSSLPILFEKLLWWLRIFFKN
jgi:hypothetical protein